MKFGILPAAVLTAAVLLPALAMGHDHIRVEIIVTGGAGDTHPAFVPDHHHKRVSPHHHGRGAHDPHHALPRHHGKRFHHGGHRGHGAHRGHGKPHDRPTARVNMP